MPLSHVGIRNATLATSAVYAQGAVQKVDELAQFIDMVTATDPQIIVEIGSYAGGTLWVWQQLAPLVAGVDLVQAGSIFAATGRERQDHGAIMISRDSHDPLTVETLRSALAGQPIDVLFIDGDHSYSGVKADHEMYAPLVRPGGLIGFHDIVEHAGQPAIEVWRYWAEIRGDDSTEIIVPTDPPWGGIGVVHAAGN